MLRFADYKNKISKSVHYHVEHDIPFAENIYRLHSEEFYKLFREARELYDKGVLLELDDWDKDLLETDIGEFGFYNGKKVPLDCPLQEEEDVELNKPKRGGPKKFYVYVNNPKTGNVKKVTFGDTTGLKVKLNDTASKQNHLLLDINATNKKIRQKLDTGLAIYQDMQKV